MNKLNQIFKTINCIIHEEGQSEFLSNLLKNTDVSESNKDPQTATFDTHKSFIHKLITEIDFLGAEIKKDNTILVSVKDQKLLRISFQLITGIGLLPCLIPGLGVNLNKRCTSARLLPPVPLTDEQKYNMLVDSTDFYTRSYEVPVLRNIIITYHLSDYLAALIQLSYAPLKKPGVYKNFIMTNDYYNKLKLDREKYIQCYDYLVKNCFQPILMKELLLLQSVTDPSCPAFATRLISKEMSRRLLAPGGLLSLIRCFIESYEVDTGLEWKKIDMLCKIVATKHGNCTEEEYLHNMCSQLAQILTSNNTHYLTTAIACALNLGLKYNADKVKTLLNDIFQTFNYDSLMCNLTLPGTIILSPQDVEHKINILHACVCSTKLDLPMAYLSQNLYVLFLLGANCTKNEELKLKIRDILLKCLEKQNKNETLLSIKSFLFGKGDMKSPNICIEEYDAGMSIKCVAELVQHPKSDGSSYFLKLLKASTDTGLIQNIFEIMLKLLVEMNETRKRKNNKDMLLVEDDPILLHNNDEDYGIILQLLSEICTLPKVTAALKTDPTIVLDFIEYFILLHHKDPEEECVTIALILLNTILTSTYQINKMEDRLQKIIPTIKRMSEEDSNINNILCKEVLSVIISDKPLQSETRCGKAISDVFDNLIPVRAHGIIELTKLIESRDTETISKKHYIFCIFQDQLKDVDSYIYLSAINGIASLGVYCPDDVLHVLCKEFLQVAMQPSQLQTLSEVNNEAEIKMKIGDVIVKVTKRLGTMAINHKAILLNTILCACRDEDPLIRTSALSNLAEIALILNYKVGTIIYEILLCIWGIIETDKAVECRRAAVMVISSLLKGLGKETLIQLKDNILPIYRTLKKLYKEDEDDIVRLHAQIALEELNDIVNNFLFPKIEMEKQIFVMDITK